jgi:hypothetical protein
MNDCIGERGLGMGVVLILFHMEEDGYERQKKSRFNSGYTKMVM